MRADSNSKKLSNFERLKKVVLSVLHKHDVKKAAFFGSVARGEATNKSDVDLVIEFSRKKSLLDLVGLKQELEDILKTNVDVLTYNSIHPLLKDRILREQKVIL